MTDVQVIEEPPASAEKGSLAIIDRAVALKMGADEIGKLVALHERLEDNRARTEFNAAMARCQKELPVVIRDKQNDHTRKMYARLETIQELIRPVYTRHGFAISFDTADSPVPDHIRVRADVMHQGGYTRTYHGDFPLDKAGAKGNDNKTSIQATGSTYSYARRYLTLLIFNLTVADEDNDGVAQSQPLTADQVGEINTLIDLCDQAGKPVDYEKFLAAYQIEHLGDLPQKRFPEAVALLKRKARAT